MLLATVVYASASLVWNLIVFKNLSQVSKFVGILLLDDSYFGSILNEFVIEIRI